MTPRLLDASEIALYNKAMKSKRMVFSIPDDLADELYEYARQADKPGSEVVRLALVSYLEAHGRRKIRLRMKWGHKHGLMQGGKKE